MADWKARNQKNKAVVWDYWQRMNHAEANQVEGIVKKAFHRNVNWNGPQPINQIRGADALIADFWEPLLHSFPDIKRTVDILMGGVAKDKEDWVSGTGYLTGTFVHDWLGIPATGKKTNIHFGQFFVIRNEKITESYVILDILAVMKQAGFQVLPPALGREGGKIQKPKGGDGVQLTEQDELEGRKTMQLVDEMGNGLMRYVRSRDLENMNTMEQHNYWHPDFHWMGPTGIGTSHSIEEFQDMHQRPWLMGFGDRGLDVDPGGRYMGHHGEGQYSAVGVWDYKFSVQHGEYQGIPATKKIITIRDFDWYKREGNYLIQNWIPIDMIDIFLQMDVDLFDRMHRQHELRKRGINWWDLPVDGMGATLASLGVAAGGGRKF
jgi:predicted ester cyclase